MPALYAAIKAAAKVDDQAVASSSLQAPSSPGRPRSTQNTEARSTARRSAPTRSPRPRPCSGFDPEKHLRGRPRTSSPTPARSSERGRGRARPSGNEAFDAWQPSNPEGAALLDRARRPASCPRASTPRSRSSRPTPRASPPAPPPARSSTRSRPVMPELWGGSADLAELEQHHHRRTRRPSCPSTARSTEWQGDPYQGRVLHFGIREHAMGVDRERHRRPRPHPRLRRHLPHLLRLPCAGAVRLGALMRRPGHSTCGRTTPSASARTARPTSRSSTSRALRGHPGPRRRPPRPTPTRPPLPGSRSCCRTTTAPPALILSRQNVPTFARGEGTRRRHVRYRRRRQGRLRARRSSEDGATARQVVLLGHRLRGPAGRRRPAKQLARPRASARVSCPCRASSGSTSRTQAYRDAVIPPAVKARVSRRGGHWHWAGASTSATPAGSVSIEHYGASRRRCKRLFREFGFTPEAVVQAAKESIAAAATA